MTTMEFTTRFAEFNKILFGFAMRITKNAEDAHDLLQEAAYRAFKNRHRFQIGTNFRAWMATIIKNTFINNYRKRSKRENLELPLDNVGFALENKNCENNALSNIVMKDLTALVEGLTDDYKIPFKMFFEGFHYEEIAEAMNIPIGTVKSRIFYARQQLKEKILDNFPQAHLGL